MMHTEPEPPLDSPSPPAGCAGGRYRWLRAIAGWAGTAELSGAVIATGVVVVESKVKKVQHPTGGIVGELRVRDDQRVNGRGRVRLDETQTRANLAVFTKSLDELYARQARLEAEKNGARNNSFSRRIFSSAKQTILRWRTFFRANASCSGCA